MLDVTLQSKGGGGVESTVAFTTGAVASVVTAAGSAVTGAAASASGGIDLIAGMLLTGGVVFSDGGSG